jgi:hypothetical protein
VTASPEVRDDPTTGGSVAARETTRRTAISKAGTKARNDARRRTETVAADYLRRRRSSRAHSPPPMFHTAGCGIATLGPLWIGHHRSRDTSLPILESRRALGAFTEPC